MTVAVTALAGCTTVRGPATPDLPAAGPRSSAPRPEGPAEPRVVQAPAREALEMIGPSASADGGTGEPRRTKRSAPAASHDAPAPPAGPEQPRSAGPAPKDTGRPAPPRPKVPELPGSSGADAGKNADVCSLGKQYGGWRPGSPEARICEQAYGR
ncbi:hypothetical protein M6G09_05120 [Streptomyces sp. B146]|nr:MULTISPECIES: hypothetical protein [Streptomyces]WFB82744.1 hypothetical protein MMU79_05110 [Streptomyces olivaceus]WGK45043.1 hypothetical protein M6G09_05120 [Streptomyces sp. B146]